MCLLSRLILWPALINFKNVLPGLPVSSPQQIVLCWAAGEVRLIYLVTPRYCKVIFTCELADRGPEGARPDHYYLATMC